MYIHIYAVYICCAVLSGSVMSDCDHMDYIAHQAPLSIEILQATYMYVYI